MIIRYKHIIHKIKQIDNNTDVFFGKKRVNYEQNEKSYTG